MSWKQVAVTFGVSWDTVFTAVKKAVAYGLAHRTLDGVTARASSPPLGLVRSIPPARAAPSPASLDGVPREGQVLAARGRFELLERAATASGNL